MSDWIILRVMYKIKKSQLKSLIESSIKKTIRRKRLLEQTEEFDPEGRYLKVYEYEVGPDDDEETLVDEYEIEIYGEDFDEVVDAAVREISDVSEPSVSGGYSKNTWYMQDLGQNTDGSYSYATYHPKGFTEEELKEIYRLIKNY